MIFVPTPLLLHLGHPERAFNATLTPHWKVVHQMWNAYFWCDDAEALHAEFVKRVGITLSGIGTVVTGLGLICAGASNYSRRFNWATLRQIADSVGAYLMADVAHYAGLIAAGTGEVRFKNFKYKTLP